jgi:hypothetical protein
MGGQGKSHPKIVELFPKVFRDSTDYFLAMMTNTMESFVHVMNLFRNLSPTMKSVVRSAVVLDMERSGDYEEIGTSDVNCHLFDLYREHGSFEKIIVNAVDLMG